MATHSFTDSAVNKNSARISFDPPQPRTALPSSWVTGAADGYIRNFQVFPGGSVNFNIQPDASGYDANPAGPDLVSAVESGIRIRVVSGSNRFDLSGIGDTTDPYSWTPANSADVTTFYNAVSHDDSATVTLKYPGPPVLPAISAQSHDRGTSLVLPAATGGAGTITYAISGQGSGVTFDSATRTVSISSTAALGTNTITYTATDEDGATWAATQTFSLTVSAAAVPAGTISNKITTLAEDSGGHAFTATGTNGTVTWQVKSGGGSISSSGHYSQPFVSANTTVVIALLVNGTEVDTDTFTVTPVAGFLVSLELTLATVFGRNVGWRTFGGAEGSPDAVPSYQDQDGNTRTVNGIFWGPDIPGGLVRLSLVNPSTNTNIAADDWPDMIRVVNGSSTADFDSPALASNQAERTQIDYAHVSGTAAASTVFQSGDTVTLQLFHDVDTSSQATGVRVTADAYEVPLAIVDGVAVSVASSQGSSVASFVSAATAVQVTADAFERNISPADGVRATADAYEVPIAIVDGVAVSVSASAPDTALSRSWVSNANGVRVLADGFQVMRETSVPVLEPGSFPFHAENVVTERSPFSMAETVTLLPEALQGKSLAQHVGQLLDDTIEQIYSFQLEGATGLLRPRETGFQLEDFLSLVDDRGLASSGVFPNVPDHVIAHLLGRIWNLRGTQAGLRLVLSLLGMPSDFMIGWQVRRGFRYGEDSVYYSEYQRFKDEIGTPDSELVGSLSLDSELHANINLVDVPNQSILDILGEGATNEDALQWVVQVFGWACARLVARAEIGAFGNGDETLVGSPAPGGFRIEAREVGFDYGDPADTPPRYGDRKLEYAHPSDMPDEDAGDLPAEDAVYRSGTASAEIRYQDGDPRNA